jgi:uncharacterized heparinase superfamily protein
MARASDDSRSATARDALAGRFAFLGRQEDFGVSVDWHRPDLQRGTRLWKTLLHEFSYAVDLAAAQRSLTEPVYRERLFELVGSWERAAPIGCPEFALDCWNARVVATRFMNLAVAGSLLGLGAGQPDAHYLSELLARHALFLRDNLEWDLRANHLLRDAVGLVFAHELFGAFPDALSLLHGQVAEQVLPDGCHVERVPLYHAIVLGDLVETQALLGTHTPDWLNDAVGRMATFLAGLLHGDGDLPLLGDSWRGELDPKRLLAEGNSAVRIAKESAPLADPTRGGGLIALRRGDVHVVVRAGPHGPGYQLGHAHADLLSFELSRGGTRLITDTGACTYDAGPTRTHLRSTAAHNTIAIDGREHLEVWGSFRVGRRGRGRIRALGGDETWTFVWASHDGYTWLPGRPIHERVVAVSNRAVLVLDVVDGGGRHVLTSRLHVHPDTPLDRLGVVCLEGDVSHSFAPLHERWGETREMPQLRAEIEADLPWAGGWLLLLDGPPSRPVETRLERHGKEIRVHYRDERLEIGARWDRGRADASGSVELFLCTPCGLSATKSGL